MSTAKVENVPLDRLRIDGETQVRAAMHEETVADYTEAYDRGESLPPGRAVFDGKDYWLWDGFHRHRARLAAGLKDMPCEVQDGTLANARWLALSANKSHGLRRTNEDKRRAITSALTMQPELSDSAIAEHCGVSDKTVATVRKTLVPCAIPEKSESRKRVDKNGRQVETARQGKRKAPSKPDASTKQPPSSGVDTSPIAPTPPQETAPASEAKEETGAAEAAPEAEETSKGMVKFRALEAVLRQAEAMVDELAQMEEAARYRQALALVARDGRNFWISPDLTSALRALQGAMPG